MKDNILKKAQIVLGVGIIIIIIAPFLLTQTGFIVFNESTGSIGDTIGGITAPLASLIGSILVFYALKAQIDANKVIQDQISQQRKEEGKRKNLEYLNEQINVLRTDIEGFSIIDKIDDSRRDTTHYIEVKGINAITKFVEDLRTYGEGDHDEILLDSNPKLAQFYYLLELIYQLVTKIQKAKINTRDKKFFFTIINYEYKTKIRAVFKANEKYRMSNVQPCKNCGKRHEGIPDEIFDLIDMIDNTLNQKEIIRMPTNGL